MVRPSSRSVLTGWSFQAECGVLILMRPSLSPGRHLIRHGSQSAPTRVSHYE